MKCDTCDKLKVNCVPGLTSYLYCFVDIDGFPIKDDETCSGYNKLERGINHSKDGIPKEDYLSNPYLSLEQISFIKGKLGIKEEI